MRTWVANAFSYNVGCDEIGDADGVARRGSCSVRVLVASPLAAAAVQGGRTLQSEASPSPSPSLATPLTGIVPFEVQLMLPHDSVDAAVRREIVRTASELANQTLTEVSSVLGLPVLSASVSVRRDVQVPFVRPRQVLPALAIASTGVGVGICVCTVCGLAIIRRRQTRRPKGPKLQTARSLPSNRTAHSTSTITLEPIEEPVAPGRGAPDTDDGGGDGLRWKEAKKAVPGFAGVTRRELKDGGAEVSREAKEFDFARGKYWGLLKGQTPGFVQVDLYDSPKVRAAYEQKRAELKRAAGGREPKEVWVYHGTRDPKAAEKIAAAGFAVGGIDPEVPIRNGNVYGNGVYTATGPETPWNYAGNPRRGSGQSAGRVILSMGLPGRTKGESEAGGGDSWVPHSDWLVFRTGSQLLPKYVIHF